MKTLKAICPVCGTKITLEQQTNEGLPKAAQPVPNKAEDRLDALRKAGVDTTNLFAMRGAAGNGMIARLDGGMLTVLDENDPIFQTIMDYILLMKPILKLMVVSHLVFLQISI